MKNFIYQVMIPKVEAEILSKTDYKTKLQELLQSNGDVEIYQVVSESGPAHAKNFEVKRFG